jgi:hypothetical protein
MFEISIEASSFDGDTRFNSSFAGLGKTLNPELLIDLNTEV